MPFPRVDAVVIGAGLAGLSCAERLLSEGLSVILLEGSGRVGGRARSVIAPFEDGQVIETGAEWVDTVHTRVRSMLDRFGIELEGEGQTWTLIRRWLHDSGDLYSAEQLAEMNPGLDTELGRFHDLQAAAAAGISDPSRPQDHLDAARLDARSLADLILEADLGPLATLFAERDSQGEFAAEASEVSALFVAQQRALYRNLTDGGPVRAHRVHGGVSSITTRMAAQFPDRMLRFGENVRRIEFDTAGATVITGRGHRYDTRWVVPACALPALARVDFSPGLDIRLAEAIRALGYGTVTKTAVQFPERAWTAGYATTRSVSQRVYDATVDQPGSHGVLMAYTGGDGGRRLGQMTEDERIHLITGDLRMMYPRLGTPTAGISRAWSAEPRYGGSYACYGPGQVLAHWEVLRQAHGPIVLAGEHTATWTGYLEGAVESGLRAAEHILAHTAG